MNFVFEDKKMANLSTLFQLPYSEARIRTFYYTAGNGELCAVIKQMRKKENTPICVYLDAPPDNEKCSEVYEELRELTEEEEYSIIVLPIPCVEYFFIRSVQDFPVFQDSECVQICANLGYYRDSKFFLENRQLHIRTFEQYCKKVLRYNVIPCLTRLQGLGKLNEGFFKHDCLYPIGEEKNRFTLLEKALRYIRQFPYVPSLETSQESARSDMTTGLWEIHRQLVKQHNQAVQEYRKRLSDPILIERCIEYKAIK